MSPGIDDEPTEVTDEQLTNPTGGRRSRRAQPTPPSPTVEPQEPPADPSLPEVYFDHFMPDEEVEEVRVKAQVWRGRNLVVLILAVLAILTAGVAVLIAIGQQRGRSRARTATTHVNHPIHPASPGPDATSATPTADAAVRSPSTDASPPPPRPRTPSSGDHPAPARPTPSGTVPMKGQLGKGQLDVLTNPPGVRVYVNGTYRGMSPLRALAPAGTRIRVVLSHEGRGLYKTRMWMPGAVGRRLKILMPFLIKPVLKARAGRTAIRVTCQTAGLHRVYIDGRDTGHDCPTVPLAVLPVVHFVALYLPTTGKTVWQKLRPKARQVTTVNFKH